MPPGLDSAPRPHSPNLGVPLRTGRPWRIRSGPDVDFSTLPPVPYVPLGFRKQAQATITAAPSSEAASFASWILLFLTSETNDPSTAVLKSQLNLFQEDLESMCPELAVMYDKRKLERGKSRVTLEKNPTLPVTPGQSLRTQT
jgi:hypothetical protein